VDNKAVEDSPLLCPHCGATKGLSLHLDIKALVRIPVKKGKPSFPQSLIKGTTLPHGKIVVEGSEEQVKLLMSNIQYIGGKQDTRISLVPEDETTVMLYCSKCQKATPIDKDNVFECNDVEFPFPSQEA